MTENNLMETDSLWSPEDFQAWLASNMATRVEQKRWILAAKRLLKGFPVEPEELLRETILRVLEGKRKLSRKVPIDVNVYGSMRSIVSSWHKQRKRKPEMSLEDLISWDDEGQDPLEVMLIPDDARASSPEEELAYKQEIEALLEIFEDRPEAQMVLMGRVDGLKGSALAEAAGLDSTALASALRLISRRLTTHRREA
ncbi:MAG: hypothetical protein AB7I22_21050 [Ramlibacter sp.]